MLLPRRLGAEIPGHSQTSSPSLPSVVASHHAWSYSLSLRVHASMTVFGVVRLFLAKISKITTASESRRYTILQSASASRTRSRSEEHTSELQSRPHLVCRLLLEKKKQYRKSRHC